MKKKPKSKQHKERNNKISRAPQSKLDIDWQGLLIITVVTGIFAGGLYYRGSSFWFAISVGLFVAYSGLPYIDPKKWKPRPFITGTLGTISGISLAILSSATAETIILSGLIGFIVGFFALQWVPHISA